MRNEVKVGVFIFLGILSLIFLTLQINSLQDINKKGYTLYALIGDASGLAKKAKVKMRGVEIGNVEDLELNGNNVKLKLFIQNGVEIPKKALESSSELSKWIDRILKKKKTSKKSSKKRSSQSSKRKRKK